MPLKIEFSFSLDPSAKILQLQGEVTLHNSTPHYKVTKINMSGHSSSLDLLPDVDIKCILVEGQRRWVHTDSGKESNLSRSVGEAIEKTGSPIDLAEEESGNEEGNESDDDK